MTEPADPTDPHSAAASVPPPSSSSASEPRAVPPSTLPGTVAGSRSSRICVSIGRTRHGMMQAEHRALAERGAELVELRIDWLQRTPDVARLLKDRPTPCIVTCRRPADRGNWRGTEEQRLMLLRTAVLEGAEYVDLEEDVAGSVPRFGATKRIVSHHDFDGTPDDLEEIHARLCRPDADLVKLVTMAHSLRDSVRMLRLVARAEFPTVGFCMGEFGLVTRVLCGRYGSPITYATFSREREMAPGQLAFDEMRTLYRYERITGATGLFGVIGDPVGHSLSPRLHNTAFARLGIDAVYVPLRIARTDFDAVLDELERLDLRACSVTIPHKEHALRRARRANGLATDIGAANTLVRGADGAWEASNTDYAAAVETLVVGWRSEPPQPVPDWRAPPERTAGPDPDAEPVPGDDPASSAEDAADGAFAGLEFSAEEIRAVLADRAVLLLGAGGAARAIGLALVRAGARLTISGRSSDRVQALAAELGCRSATWENRGTVPLEILVNCTPVGMHPEVDETPFAENWLEPHVLVFDTIYNPEQTLLLKQAAARGCRIVSGLEMFVRQAARQFVRFTGRDAPLDLFRDTLRETISPVGPGR